MHGACALEKHMVLSWCCHMEGGCGRALALPHGAAAMVQAASDRWQSLPNAMLRCRSLRLDGGQATKLLVISIRAIWAIWIAGSCPALPR